jgi:type IV secretory pathway protease TraF
MHAVTTPAVEPTPGGQGPRRLDPLRLARIVRRSMLPIALGAAAIFWVCFGMVKVPLGMDTMPTIPPESLCVLDKRVSQAGVGHEVFVEVPDGGTLLSRVLEVTPDDRIVVRNDNAQSLLPDSRVFGPLSRSRVLGVVIFVVPGPSFANEEIRGR